MALGEEIINSFQFFGFDVEEDVVKKCVELCNVYCMSAEDLVDEWCAFTASNLGGETPRLDTLILMEKKELVKNNKVNVKNKLNISNKNILSHKSDISIHEEKSATPITPERNNILIPKQLLSDATQSIICDKNVDIPLVKYADRTNSGAIVHSYGVKCLLSGTSDFSEENIKVTLLGEEDDWESCNFYYMYEGLKLKSSYLNNTVDLLGGSIAEKNKLEVSSLNSVGSCIIYGRVCCDSNGKLNGSSVLLQSSYKIAHGDIVSLNLTKLEKYSIFPGQVIVVNGDYLKNSFVVRNIYAAAPLEFPKLPQFSNCSGKLQILIAAGPFTLSNNLTYEPLKDLLKYIQMNKPHIVVLIGPFVDICNKHIHDTNNIETYESVFHGLIDNVMTAVKGLNVHVVLVASAKDVHHHTIYPTPPYKVKTKYEKLYCVPDPCVLNVNGIIFGLTSVDILFHLAKEELSYGLQNTDRMERLVSYLLNQQSFYPLYPPNPEIYINNESLEKYGTLSVLPHVLVLPSNLKWFIKEIDGCIVINPERLTKVVSGGTFCHIKINNSFEGSLNNNINCDILYV